MPHIIIEYSGNLEEILDIQDLVDRLHETAIEHGGAPVAAVRTRAAARPHFKVANGDPSFGFIAVAARLGPGRTEAAKTRFVEALVESLERAIDPVRSTHAIALSAEIQEIDPNFRINSNHVRSAMEAEDG